MPSFSATKIDRPARRCVFGQRMFCGATPASAFATRRVLLMTPPTEIPNRSATASTEHAFPKRPTRNKITASCRSKLSWLPPQRRQKAARARNWRTLSSAWNVDRLTRKAVRKRRIASLLLTCECQRSGARCRIHDEGVFSPRSLVFARWRGYFSRQNLVTWFWYVWSRFSTTTITALGLYYRSILCAPKSWQVDNIGLRAAKSRTRERKSPASTRKTYSSAAQRLAQQRMIRPHMAFSLFSRQSAAWWLAATNNHRG